MQNKAFGGSWSDIASSLVLPVRGKVSVRGVQVSGRDLLTRHQRKRILQKRLDPRTLRIAAPYFGTPKIRVVVKVLPVFLIRRFGVLTDALELVQQGILDEIRRQQRRPPRIQSFKNKLCIVFFIEINHDQPDIIPNGAVQGCDLSLLGATLGFVEPLRDSAVEEQIRVGDIALNGLRIKASAIVFQSGPRDRSFPTLAENQPCRRSSAKP